MQLACQDMLAAGGFRQYEVSAYARDGRRCAHNLNYWQFGDYLGIGAGAHGKITAAGEVLRTVRVRQPRQYLESLERAPAPPEIQAVARADLPFEYMLNALRLVDGFSVQGFEDRTGLDFDAVEPRILQAVTQGMLEERPRRTWRATPLGWRFLNDVIAAFLPSPHTPFRGPCKQQTLTDQSLTVIHSAGRGTT
jgi:oxygen-independent coproporphyrinogen-3 oxidase